MTGCQAAQDWAHICVDLKGWQDAIGRDFWARLEAVNEYSFRMGIVCIEVDHQLEELFKPKGKASTRKGKRKGKDKGKDGKGKIHMCFYCQGGLCSHCEPQLYARQVQGL